MSHMKEISNFDCFFYCRMKMGDDKTLKIFLFCVIKWSHVNEIYDGSDDGGAAHSYAYFSLLFSRLYFPFTSAKIEIFFITFHRELIGSCCIIIIVIVEPASVMATCTKCGSKSLLPKTPVLLRTLNLITTDIDESYSFISHIRGLRNVKCFMRYY